MKLTADDHRLPSRESAGARYEVLGYLAAGGMAELQLARTAGLGGFEKLLVVKTLPVSLAANPRCLAMFLDEARIAATLHHTNIAQVYDVGRTGSTVFMAMEFLFGQDLAAIQRKAAMRGLPIPYDQAIAMLLGACAGLHHAHEQCGQRGEPLGIVHRDVSPHNVIVTYDGGVKVIDFGIAKAADRTNRTITGVLRGTLGYMSPEQARCAPLDRRSDVYCLAILLAELTTGHRVFSGDSDYALLQQVVEGAITPPSAWIPDYPLALERIVLRGLDRDPERRYQTAHELLLALDEVARERSLDVSQHSLARFMESLFEDELEQWREAQRQGVSLAAFIMKSRARAHHRLSDDLVLETGPLTLTATTLLREPRARMPPRWKTRLARAAGALAVVGVVALGLGLDRREAVPVVRSAPANATQAQQPSPVLASPAPTTAQPSRHATESVAPPVVDRQAISDMQSPPEKRRRKLRRARLQAGGGTPERPHVDPDGALPR